MILTCTIKRDFEYNKVMPTFHHWKTGNKRYGITFHTAADARAFDKGVTLAIEDVLDGKTCARACDSINDGRLHAVDFWSHEPKTAKFKCLLRLSWSRNHEEKNHRVASP